MRSQTKQSPAPPPREDGTRLWGRFRGLQEGAGPGGGGVGACVHARGLGPALLPGLAVTKREVRRAESRASRARRWAPKPAVAIPTPGSASARGAGHRPSEHGKTAQVHLDRNFSCSTWGTRGKESQHGASDGTPETSGGSHCHTGRWPQCLRTPDSPRDGATPSVYGEDRVPGMTVRLGRRRKLWLCERAASQDPHGSGSSPSAAAENRQPTPLAIGF